MSQLTQTLRECIDKNIPFVSYRLPCETKVITRIQLSGNIRFYKSLAEMPQNSGFVYAPFHITSDFPVVFFENDLIVEGEPGKNLLLKLYSQERRLSVRPQKIPVEITREEYLGQANHFIGSFTEIFQKAALSLVTLLEKPPEFNEVSFFLHLLVNHPDAFCHLIFLPEQGLWAGATPETLLRIDGGTASTCSLAGTQPAQKTNMPLTWDKKETEEQQIVTTYIERALKDWGIKEYTKAPLQTVKAGNVAHLSTTFRFSDSLIATRLFPFLATLHPTPAVCGFPKDKAMELILKTEKHDRAYYSGFCGHTDHNGKTGLFVNLRCMQVFPEVIALYAGGGLTALSDPTKEWEEIQLKTETLTALV